MDKIQKKGQEKGLESCLEPTEDHKGHLNFNTIKESTKNDDAPKKETKHPERLDPTRYGDWEKNGRCIDF